MKAIVTGGAGFIGSHLVEELINQSMEVHVIDNMTFGKSQNVHPLAIIHTMDIRSADARNVIVKVKPDVVFHLAAQADVTQSINHPFDDASININGTINMLEACHEANVKKFVFASTSAVYGDLQVNRLSEEDSTEPISYYGLSKLTAEAYIKQFNKLYQLPFTILRYGNVYGPRQQAKGEGGVVAIFIDKLVKGDPITIFGNGEQTRDFIYVKDIAHANIAAIENGDNEIIQVGTGERTSVNRLIDLLEQIGGGTIETKYSDSKPGDIKHSCLDNTKANQLLKCAPYTHIFNGLEETYKEETSGRAR